MVTFLLALIVGVIFVTHGLAKREYLTNPTLSMEGFPSWVGKVLAVAETLGGLALIIHFLLILAAIGLTIIILGALYYKIIKWKSPFMGVNGWEFDLLLLGSLLVLIFV